jgi:hypothetical protein
MDIFPASSSVAAEMLSEDARKAAKIPVYFIVDSSFGVADFSRHAVALPRYYMGYRQPVCSVNLTSEFEVVKSQNKKTALKMLNCEAINICGVVFLSRLCACPTEHFWLGKSKSSTR